MDVVKNAPAIATALSVAVGASDDEQRSVLRLLQQSPNLPTLVAAVEKGSVQLPNPRMPKLLLLLQTLCEISNNNIDLALKIISSGKVTDLKSVAASHFDPDLSLKLSISSDKLSVWQQNLFNFEPTAVLSYLVRSKKIELAEEIRSAVQDVFAVALQTGFNITKDSVRQLQKTSGQLSTQTRDLAFPVMKTLQRLQAIVTSAQDIVVLYNNGFESANMIAVLSVDDFLQGKLPENTRRQIHGNASTVSVRNQHCWRDLLAAKTADLFPAIRTKSSDPGNPPSYTDPSYASMFGETDPFECADCEAVFSPAAYLADLLQTLSLYKTEVRTNEEGVRLPSRSLLEMLTLRRPDLLEIELSCHNTNTRIPYIDITLEVMESFLAKKYKIEASDAGIPPRSASSDGNLGQVGIRTSQFPIYEKYLAPKVFPLEVFPFNMGTQTIRAILKASGTSLLNVMRIFASEHRTFHEWRHSSPDNSPSADALVVAKRMSQTIQACEIIGLQEEDYVCFTRESYISLDLWRLMNTNSASLSPEEYQTKMVGYDGCPKYWGYSNSDDMINQETGLTVVTQVLDRGKISFTELIEVLKTGFLGGRLIITSLDGCRGFRQDISGLRMRSSVFVDRKGALNEAVCNDLQIFLRLRRILDVSISDLDIILTSLDQYRLTQTSGLSRKMICELASILQLRNISKQLNLRELCSLWDNIAPRGPSASVYAALLKLAADEEPKGASELISRQIVPSKLLVPASPQTAAVLRIPASDWSFILQYMNLVDAQVLNLSQASQIYRLGLFAKLINVKITQLALAHKTIGANLQNDVLFESPTSVYQAYVEWATLIDRGFNPLVLGALTEQEAMGPILGTADTATTKVLSFIGKITKLQDKTSLLELTKKAYSNAYPAIDPRTIESSIEDLNLGRCLTDYGEIRKFTGPSTDTNWQGYLLPSSLGSIHVVIDAKTEITPVLVINGETIKVEKQSEKKYIGFVEFKTYDWHSCSLNMSPQNVKWPEISSGTLFCHQTVFKTHSTLFKILEHASTLFQSCPLNDEELQILGCALYRSSQSDMQTTPKLTALFTETGLGYEILPRLFEYKLLRDSIPEKDKVLFLQFLGAKEVKGTDTTNFVARITGLSLRQATEVLQAKFPSMSNESTATILRDPGQLLALKHIANFLSKVDIPGTDIEDLFTLAQPFTNVSDIFEMAKKLVEGSLFVSEQSGDARLESVKAAALTLREGRRNALLSFLLNHTDLQETEAIIDADSLYEFFLVDVNSGPVPETSRISHAVSVVQLYIQRCFLGLEEKRGVTISDVNKLRSQWTHYGKYTTWEANRKVFLFPENWILPSLRDSKTEEFQAFENAIMQNDLSEANINSAIKNYVYSVNKLAFLDVQAYLWDKGQGGRGVFHFFARTRTEPYQFFYRSLQIKFLGSQRLCYWEPWQAIDVEIPNQTVDKDGEKPKKNGCYLIPALVKGRLFLFVPEIAYKSKPSTPESNESLYKLAQKDGSADIKKSVVSRWEIRLAWTERRNDKWSARSVSTDAIVVETKQGGLTTLPSLSSFRFRLRSRAPEGYVETGPVKKPVPSDSLKPASDIPAKSTPESPSQSEAGSSLQKLEAKSDSAINFGVEGILVIDVECWQGDPDRIPTHLGQFEMRDSLISASSFTPSPFKDVSKPRSLPTSFSKLTWDMPSAESQPLPPYTIVERRVIEDKKDATAKDLEIAPLLADVHEEDEVNDDKAKQIAWTLIFDETQISRPLGLVVDVTSQAHGPKSYFALPPIREIDPWVKSVDLTDMTDVYPLHHRQSNSLVSAATMSNGISAVYKVLQTSGNDPFGFGLHGRAVYHESFDASSIYNWELGVHILILVVERLQATQQFELALQYLNLVFDPTIDNTDSTKCWLFPPFADAAMKATQSIADALSNLKKGGTGSVTFLDLAVDEWKANPFNAHSIARGRPAVYMKRFVMKYVEILVAAGDVHFRRNTMESIPLAMQRYIEASHVFGRSRRKTKAISDRPGRSYKQLKDELNYFSNANLDLEVEFPYSCLQRGSATNEDNKIDRPKSGLPGVLLTTYFGVPQNSQMITLRGLIDDRITKIRNSQDINGQRSILPLFEPPVDPGLLVQQYGARNSGGNNSPPEPEPGPLNYRFIYLIQRALDMNSEFRAMTEMYLSAREKGDAEEFSILKSQQEKMIADMNISMRVLAKEEAERTMEVLKDNVKSAESRLKYYLKLIGEKSRTTPIGDQPWSDIQQNIPDPSQDDLRMSPEEKLDFRKAEEASSLTLKSSVLTGTAGILSSLPNLTSMGQPMGVGVALKIDGENAAKALNATATVLSLRAQIAGDEGARASRKAGMIKQLQERRLQANITGREIVNLNKQIAAQKTRIAMSEAEIKAAQVSFDQATATEAWYKSKFSNRQLYTWLENTTQTLNFELYTMTIDMARRAEQALRFEKGNLPSAPIIDPRGYWNGSHNGLMSAQSLMMALKKLELANMDTSDSDFELTKNISLRQLNPAALIRLRAEGKSQFSLPEETFDLDFPGHYFRRIKSIAISIPCITGPYTSINATLTLDKDKIRKTSITTVDSYPATDRDERFITDSKTPVRSVALSERVSATGMFELSLSGERFLPFENAGAISTWMLELPRPSIAQFDYGTISDVIVHLKYTSRNGGANLRDGAIDAIQKFRTGVSKLQEEEGLFALIDLTADCSNEWRAACRNPTGAAAVTLTMDDVRRYLPFWAQASVKLTSMAVALKRKSETIKTGTVAPPLPTMAVKLSADGSTRPNMTLTTSFLKSENAKDVKDWVFYQEGSLSIDPENVALNFTNTESPTQKLQLGIFEHAFVLVKFQLG